LSALVLRDPGAIAERFWWFSPAWRNLGSRNGPEKKMSAVSGGCPWLSVGGLDMSVVGCHKIPRCDPRIALRNLEIFPEFFAEMERGGVYFVEASGDSTERSWSAAEKSFWIFRKKLKTWNVYPVNRAKMGLCLLSINPFARPRHRL
jgi:hypothetical protein